MCLGGRVWGGGSEEWVPYRAQCSSAIKIRSGFPVADGCAGLQSLDGWLDNYGVFVDVHML